METLTIYFDRCFGKRLPEALHRARPPFDVQWQHNKHNRFKQDMKDDDWLALCGQRGWIAFSHDRKFHGVEVEAEAIKQHKVAAFAICGGHEETWAKLTYFVKAYPRIMNVVSNEKPPYFYRIHPTLRLERIEL